MCGKDTYGKGVHGLSFLVRATHSSRNESYIIFTLESVTKGFVPEGTNIYLAVRIRFAFFTIVRLIPQSRN